MVLEKALGCQSPAHRVWCYKDWHLVACVPGCLFAFRSWRALPWLIEVLFLDQAVPEFDFVGDWPGCLHHLTWNPGIPAPSVVGIDRFPWIETPGSLAVLTGGLLLKDSVGVQAVQ